MKNLIHISILVSILLLTFLACDRNNSVNSVEPKLSSKSNGNVTISSIEPYPLDWENIDRMPTPSGTPEILVPWASGASRQFSTEISNDYKSSDGWVLLYNTFNTNVIPDNWYFILYNQFRGIIRLYYYIPSNANFISSTNIVHKLATEGSYASSSPLLNFADQTFVDVNNNSSFASKIEDSQVARSTWYIFQYELAYDENLSNQDFNSFKFVWPIRSTQVTDVSINGTVSGSLNGTISNSSTDYTLSPNISIDSRSNISITGSSDAEKLKPNLGQQLVNNIKTAITDGAQGVVKNFLSGIFSGSGSGSGENVDLRLKANVSLSGSLTSDFLLSSTAFAIPGYDQSSTTGFVPKENVKPGVFYISDRPTVNLTYQEIPAPPCAEEGAPDDYYRYFFSLDENSFQPIFNPAVEDIAEIENIDYDVLIRPSLGLDIVNCASFPLEEEMIGIGTFYDVNSLVTLHPTIGESSVYVTVYVRMSFDVVPNNGSDPVTIAKTFTANAVI